MKHSLIIGALALACAGAPATTQAQGFLKNLFGGGSSSSSSTETSTQPSATTQDALGGLLNGVIGGASGSGSATGNIISGLLASVTGGLTTTRANLVGTWTYTEPAVQFESDNMLAQAGSSLASNKVEEKLAKYYKMVGITAGKLIFTFNDDGSCTYAIGKKQMSGTWDFDSETKKVTITTSAGIPVTTYVTISGTQLSLCFDGTKVLSLFTSLGSSLSSVSSTIGTVSSLASNFDGMKIGFAFKK